MRKLLLILIFLIKISSLFACLSASQNRLFPLGQTSKGLCVVETHLFRTEYYDNNKVEFDELKPAWGGISYFKIYNNDYAEVYAEIIDTIWLFEEYRYDSIIENVFKKGLKIANTYPDFIIAKPVSIIFCDYQEKCSEAVLSFNTLKNNINIKLSNNTKYDLKIIFDTASIASNVTNYYLGFDDAELSAKSLKGSLYINSVRQFQIGEKTLSIVHIGIGQMPTDAIGKPDPQRKAYNATFAFSDINKSVYQEPVLHHGHGFDFFIWK